MTNQIKITVTIPRSIDEFTLVCTGDDLWKVLDNTTQQLKAKFKPEMDDWWVTANIPKQQL